MANLVADSTPDFYLENIKRLVRHGIQPYFALPHIHGLELVERLIRKGYYMGPMNGFFSIGGGGVCGANPFDLMELIRRTPHGSFFTYQTTFRLTHPVAAICIALGQHTRAGIEDNLWDTTKGKRMSTIQMIERHVRMANELGRPMLHRTGAPDAEDRSHLQINRGNASQSRPAADRRPATWGSLCMKRTGCIIRQPRADADIFTLANGKKSWTFRSRLGQTAKTASQPKADRIPSFLEGPEHARYFAILRSTFSFCRRQRWRTLSK